MAGIQIRGGLAAIAALSTAAAVHAGPGPTSLYVDASAPAGGNGSSWSQAFRDLQDALALAKVDPNPAKQYDIRVAQGVYTPDRGTGNRAMTFLVASGMTLTGGFAGLAGANPDRRDPSQFVSVLSGDLGRNDGPAFANMSENSYTVVRVAPVWYEGSQPGDIEISGFTISGGLGESGNAPGGVAVAFSDDWSVTLRSCVIKNNRGWRGGGIASECRLSVIGTTIESNGSLLQGGGIYTSEYLRLEGSTVTRNFSEFSDGGGISGGYVSAENSIISDNFAMSYGGGIQATRGEFTNCTVAGNSSATAGGGLHIESSWPSGVLAMNHCLIADNSAGVGAGIASLSPFGASVDLLNCTIVANRGTQTGGGIKTAGPLRIANSILAYNESPGVSVAIVSQGLFKLQRCCMADGTNLQGAPLVSLSPSVSGNPQFVYASGPAVSWRSKNYRLRAGSICVDAADSTTYAVAAGVDLDGKSWPVEILVATNTGIGVTTSLDIGAYETHPLCTADFDGSGQPTIDDLFWFFNLYFIGDVAANIDQVNGVTIDDLFFFLNAWFRGC